MREVNREDIRANTAQKMMFSIKDYLVTVTKSGGLKKVGNTWGGRGL